MSDAAPLERLAKGTRQALSGCWATALAVLGRALARGRDARGDLLLETLVAIAVFATIGTAVLAGISVARTTGAKVDHQSVAEKLARNQMENVFNQPYQGPLSTPYPTIVPPAGYSVSVAATGYLLTSVDIEKVTVTVSVGDQTVPILVLDTLRAK